MNLPEEIVTIMGAFAPVFSDRVWRHAQALLVGAILAQGKRTVTAALRVMGLSQERHSGQLSSGVESGGMVGPTGEPDLVGIDRAAAGAARQSRGAGGR